MVRALGYSVDVFDPADPGRLCRGRERWIDSLPMDEPVRLHRVTVTGASFSDETAGDAVRGLTSSGVSMGEVLSALMPLRRVIAVAEDANARLVPEEAADVEHYTLTRPAGPLHAWRVRWTLPCADAPSVDAAVAAGADVLLVLGPRTTAKGKVEPLSDQLREAAYLLMGFRQDGLPSRRFQPSALPVLLEQCFAVGLVHQDKHSAGLAVYTREPMASADALVRLARARGAVPVPFAIPPMLARWDRALWELRQGWDESAQGEFPVPPAASGGRRGRRQAPQGEE